MLPKNKLFFKITLILNILGSFVTPNLIAQQLPEFKPESVLEKEMLNIINKSKVHDPCVTLTILKLLVTDAKEKKEAAPKYDLCNLYVPDTNLFCKDSKGIIRLKMPQLAGRPRPGSKAEELPKDQAGLVNGAEEFIKFLKKKGIKVAETKEPAMNLKATQNELIGPKVAGIWWAMEEDPKKYTELLNKPIFISKDNYVLDGHHRWAAIVARQFGDRALKDIEMKVLKVDQPITKLVDLANQFANEFGIMPEAAA